MLILLIFLFCLFKCASNKVCSRKDIKQINTRKSTQEIIARYDANEDVLGMKLSKSQQSINLGFYSLSFVYARNNIVVKDCVKEGELMSSLIKLSEIESQLYETHKKFILSLINKEVFPNLLDEAIDFHIITFWVKIFDRCIEYILDNPDRVNLGCSAKFVDELSNFTKDNVSTIYSKFADIIKIFMPHIDEIKKQENELFKKNDKMYSVYSLFSFSLIVCQEYKRCSTTLDTRLIARFKYLENICKMRIFHALSDKSPESLQIEIGKEFLFKKYYEQQCSALKLLQEALKSLYYLSTHIDMTQSLITQLFKRRQPLEIENTLIKEYLDKTKYCVQNVVLFTYQNDVFISIAPEIK